MNTIAIALPMLLALSGEPPKTNRSPSPGQPIPKISVEVTHDKFAKTITRVFRQDIGNAADTEDIELSLEATSVTTENVLNAETPTNVFVLIVRIPHVVEGKQSEPVLGHAMLQISCDGKPLEEVLKGKLPKPPAHAQRIPVIYARKDCLISAYHCSITGNYWAPTAPMWIVQKGGSVDCNEKSKAENPIVNGTLEVGFVCASEVVSLMGKPKKIECRVAPLSYKNEPVVELGSFSIGPKQWNQIDLFSKRILAGR